MSKSKNGQRVYFTWTTSRLLKNIIEAFKS